VERALKGVPGVESASVNFATARASVGGTATLGELARGVRGAGYDVGTRTALLVNAGEETAAAVRGLDGVLEVRPAAGGIEVVHVDVEGMPERLRAAAGARPGGGAVRVESEEDPEAALRARTIRAWRARFLAGACVTAIVMPASMHATRGVFPSWMTDWHVLFVLAGVVQFGVGGPFLRGAWAAVRRRSADMDVLIAVGTLAAFLYSAAATFLPGLFVGEGLVREVWYDTSVTIVTLICLGRWLEERAKGRAGEAIRRLAGLRPRTARVVRGGDDVDVPVADLAVGDVVRVRPGESVATDGVVVTGASALDESLLTGESLPVEKGPGAEVTGGTVNRTGSFTFRVTKVGRDTALEQIVRLVRAAQGGKAPAERLADRVAAVFVPVVLAIGAAAFAAWWALGPEPRLNHALQALVTVLIIACPCALGLATPTAVLVATGRAAERGILVRSGETLETAERVTTVLFDKTGTLTEGRPEVVDASFLFPDAREHLARAAAVEKLSEHPVAQAVVRAARKAGLAITPAERFEAVPGRGVVGTVHGADGAPVEVLVGNAAHLRERGVDPAALEEPAAAFAAKGASPLFVAFEDAAGKRPVGVIAVGDRVKPGARDAVARLSALGLPSTLVSGDRPETARAVAAEVGIERVLAEVSPAAKAAEVARLQAAGEVVAFVGDGINDGPALARADVGIALGAGTDVAREASDLTLLGDDLGRVPDAVLLSRKTTRTIRQNLFWAFAYNVLGIPVAAGVLVPFGGPRLDPMFAAAAMALSSTFVVANSLRLRRA
jgi:Cu+-exporting ATPase